jgi:hypothetical protein
MEPFALSLKQRHQPAVTAPNGGFVEAVMSQR